MRSKRKTLGVASNVAEKAGKSTVAIIATTILSKVGIESARNINTTYQLSNTTLHELCKVTTSNVTDILDVVDPALKNDIKNNFSITASVLSLALLSFDNVLFVSDLLTSGVWNRMTAPQKAVVVTAGLVGVGATAYTAIVAGQEKQTLVSGLVSAAGTLTVGAARYGMSIWRHQEPKFERIGFDTDNETYGSTDVSSAPKI